MSDEKIDKSSQKAVEITEIIGDYTCITDTTGAYITGDYILKFLKKLALEYNGYGIHITTCVELEMYVLNALSDAGIKNIRQSSHERILESSRDWHIKDIKVSTHDFLPNGVWFMSNADKMIIFRSLKIQ